MLSSAQITPSIDTHILKKLFFSSIFTEIHFKQEIITRI